MRGLVLALMLLVTPAWAVQPDEILSDPVLEQRARNLSKGLRCLVCRNESIDESNASLARDLRILLRERLVAGDSDTQAVGYIVDRYGEYVLLSPPATGSTWLLWGAGPLMLLLAGGASLLYVRGRAHAKTPDQTPLSAEEQTRLDKILNG